MIPVAKPPRIPLSERLAHLQVPQPSINFRGMAGNVTHWFASSTYSSAATAASWILICRSSEHCSVFASIVIARARILSVDLSTPAPNPRLPLLNFFKLVILTLCVFTFIFTSSSFRFFPSLVITQSVSRASFTVYSPAPDRVKSYAEPTSERICY